MKEVILIRCGKSADGEYLYRITVDGKTPKPLFTLADSMDILRHVEEEDNS